MSGLTEISKVAKAISAGERAAPAVNRLDMSFKDVTKRIPELTEAANKLANDEITASQYDKLVNKFKPVTPYNFVPKPATAEEAINALSADAKGLFGVPSKTLQAGDPVGLRLDIPAYRDYGVWVPTVHEQASGFGAGKKVGHESVAAVKNPQFGMSEKAALSIATGKPKGTIATIKGEWNPITEDDAVARAQEYLNHPEWRQVGMDPERHSYFYDRETMQPILSGEEAVQVGPLVLTKNPVYGKKKNFPFKAGGPIHMQVGGALNALERAYKATQVGAKVLPAAEREANLAKFLEPSVEKDVLYHGTANNIRQFKNIPRPLKWGAKPKPDMFFVSTDPVVSNQFALQPKTEKNFGNTLEDDMVQNMKVRSGANVMPVHVQVKNPFDPTNPEHVASIENHMQSNPDKFKFGTGAIMNNIRNAGYYAQNKDDNFLYLEHPWVQKAIKSAGFDGFYTTEMGAKNIGIYDPSKIKSAIGNRGTYDTSNPDITKKTGGTVHLSLKNPALKSHIKHLHGFASGGQVRHYADGNLVEPLSIPDAPVTNEDRELASRMKNMMIEQAKREGRVLSTPEGRSDVATRIGTGLLGGVPDLVNLAQSYIPGLNKTESVFGGDKVARFPVSGTSGELNTALKQAGALGENEAPITEMIGSMVAPSGATKLAGLTKGLPVGLATKNVGEPIANVLKTQRANAPKNVADVFENVTDPAEALKIAQAGKHLKIDPKTGKYIGLGSHIDSPQALGALRGRVSDLVGEGAWNADWYLRQQQMARELAEDPTAQSLLARGTAAYSPQAMPKVELPAFARQHNEKVLTGEDVAPRTGAQMKNVAKAYDIDPVTGEITYNPQAIKLGKKTGPYANKKDPTVPVDYKTANDIWHARAFELGEPGELFSRGLTPQEHGVLHGENLLLADRANKAGIPVGTTKGATHDASTAQAATWGATRYRALEQEDLARFNKEQAARDRYEANPEKWRTKNPGKTPPKIPTPVRTPDELRAYGSQGLDTALPNQSAYLTKEAVTGEGLGHLPGMPQMSEADRLAYTQQMMGSIGRDPTLEALGMYSKKPVPTTGEFMNDQGVIERNPGWVNQVLVSNATSPTGRVTPASEREALNLAAHLDAIMGAQQAGAWSRFHPEGTPGLRVRDLNALGVDTSQLKPEQIGALRQFAQEHGLAGIDYGDRFGMTRFGNEGVESGIGTELGKLMGKKGPAVPFQRGQLETGYEPSNITTPGAGTATQSLLDRLDNSTIQNLYQRLDASRWRSEAQAKNQIDKAWAATKDLPLREDLIKLRDIISESGFSGLKKHVAKYGTAGLPAAAFLDVDSLQSLPSSDSRKKNP